MHTQRNRTLLKRHLLLVVVVILGALLQNCPLPVLEVRLCVLLPLTVIIAMFEKELPGTLYGILAGMLWDVSASTADGMKALFLSLVGCVCGLLVRYFLRNNLLSALMLCGVTIFLFSTAHWLIHIAPNGAGMWQAWFRIYLPQALLTLLTSPVLYFLIRALKKQFRVQDKEAAL